MAILDPPVEALPRSTGLEQPRPPAIPAQYRYNSQVSDVSDYHKPDSDVDGFITYERFTMDDGFYYHVMTGIPANQKTKIPIDMSTPWLTNTEGHNEYLARKFMHLGFPIRLIGAERIPVGCFANPLDLFRAIKKGFDELELARSAHNNLQILDASSREHHYLIQPGQSVWFGASRPAMMAPGIQMMAPHHDRNIVFSNEIDPCVHDKLDVPRLVQILKEGGVHELKAMAALRKIILTSHSKHYLRTLDFAPDHVVGQVLTFPALMSGQAGDLAKLSPRTVPRAIDFFANSSANNQAQFRSTYSDHENVHINDLSGSHLSIPRKDIVDFIVARMGIVLDELSTHDDDPTEINFEKVFALSAQTIQT